jgi:hypothetical protein
MGMEDIVRTIENQKYPNWCICPQVISSEERDIGEWDDSHPLNQLGTFKGEFERVFGY